MMIKQCLFLFIALILNIGISFGQTKKVFAHYMVCFTSYGNGTVEGYKKDIQDAQNLGIDGFALNCGSWDSSYKLHVAHLFQAAAELGTNFKVFFSVDRCCNITDNQVEDMIQTYANSPNYFKFNTRPFLSAWGGGGSFKNVVNDLKRKGHNLYFVPFLYSKGLGNYDVEIPDYNTVLENYTDVWKNYIDGYFYFGAVGIPVRNNRGSDIDVAESIAKVTHDNKITFMSFVSPEYWGDKQGGSGRRYYEYNGGEGLISEWESIIKIQKPEWVELTTWNDWTEGTYFSPISNIDDYLPTLRQYHNEKGFYKSHKGFAELSRYYIQWYKTGMRPAIKKDEIFYFYRTQSKNIDVSDPKGKVSKLNGEVDDEIYVTSFLTAPAELVVSSGKSTTNYKLPRGINNTRMPFSFGKQYFKVLRNGKTIINQQGEDIIQFPQSYNFYVYSGSATSKD